jgi:cytochrome-b5 reductase
MIAGGTGIAPMFQIIKAVCSNPTDRTQLSLIFANVAEEDILMREELDALAAAHPHKFRVFYVVQNAPANWTGGVGFVSQDHIKEHLPPTSEDIKILLCGASLLLTSSR